MQNNTFFGHYQPLPIIVLEETASTNDYSKQLLSNFKPQIDFTAIMAKHQSQGRGQRGTTWITKAGVNMTASFIYSPPRLPVSEQFILTVHASLAVYDTLQAIVPSPLSIKWPNDIMIGNKKIAGILIENQIGGHFIKNVIVGIGLNVYQTVFPAEIAHRSTSLLLENPNIDLTILDLTSRIQHRLRHYQDIFLPENFASHLALYNDRLFLKDTDTIFLIDAQPVKGRIKGVEKDGYLIVHHSFGTRKYDLKDIVYQL